MAKKKKHEATKREMLLQWLSILGALFLIPTVLPPVPWRYAQANGNMGARFSMYRYYSLFSVTNNVGQHTSWMKMRKEVCRKMEQFNKPNPLAMVVGAVSQHVVGAGGAIAGCESWEMCKQHVGTRCSAYMTIQVGGIGAIMFILIGGICAACTPLLLSQEQSAGKKKKKKQAAKESTMYISIAAFMLNFMGVTTWIFLSDSQLKAMKGTGYYPYPPLFVGGYLAAFGTFLLFCSMYCGITRIYPLFKDASAQADEDNEDDEDAALADAPPPGALPPGADGFDPMIPGGPPPPEMPPGVGGAPPPGQGQPAW